MRVEFSDGVLLRGDGLLRAVLRTDLTPVPSTVEIEVREDDSMAVRFAEGQVFFCGRERDAYRVVKLARKKDFGMVVKESDVRALTATAELDACHPVSFRMQRAIIKENASVGEVYRACGATAQVATDLQIPRFSCFIGQVPSFALATVLQEESAAACWREGKLNIFRLTTLAAQDPVETIQRDTSKEIESGFLERHTVPWFYSTDTAGQFAFGPRVKARDARYVHRTGPRILNNLSRVLLLRRILIGTFAPQINAGDVLQVATSKFVVITAAHVFETGADGSGSNQYSRFWLGEVQDG
jgi:hypothetical protein